MMFRVRPLSPQDLSGARARRHTGRLIIRKPNRASPTPPVHSRTRAPAATHCQHQLSTPRPRTPASQQGADCSPHVRIFELRQTLRPTHCAYVWLTVNLQADQGRTTPGYRLSVHCIALLRLDVDWAINNIRMNRQQRLLTLMLVVCSVSLPTAIIFGLNFFIQNSAIQDLKSRLLAETELQAQLLAAAPSDYSLTPHRIKNIGFVLNPHSQSSTFKAPEGTSYRINSLGLRGGEIEKKTDAETRILLVGDSVVFGWKLHDEDRLSSILNRLYARYSSDDQRTRFATVALPGWNVESAHAFLESHLRLLDPDAVVWWTIANDVEDVPGVIPPAQLANWASPQADNSTPFSALTSLQKRTRALIPIIQDKRAANLAAIRSFQDRYNIPVFLIADDSLLDEHARTLFSDQHIRIPQRFLDDSRWPLSRSDRHPTPWANEVMALGILDKLMRAGIIEHLDFNDEALRVTQAVAALESREPSASPAGMGSADTQSRLPTGFRLDDPKLREGLVYGIGSDGEMSQAGTLLLRDPGRSSALLLTFAPVANMEKYPGSVLVTVRNRALNETTVVIGVDSSLVATELRLPAGKANSPIYEVSWTFDYVECQRPSVCASGRLIEARFIE